ncbi:hypothetical protein FRC15_004571 [Serendipita sp. 397]|nr:hypothetical protein FRC15_004571 [Serendipita sp. 397]
MANAPPSIRSAMAPTVTRPNPAEAASQSTLMRSFEDQNSIGGASTPLERDRSYEKYFGKSNDDSRLQMLQDSIVGRGQIWGSSDETSTTFGQPHAHRDGGEEAWLEQPRPFRPRPPREPLIFATPVVSSPTDVHYPLMEDYATKKALKEELELKGLEKESQKTNDSFASSSQQTYATESTEESSYSDEHESPKPLKKAQRKSEGPRYCPRDITKNVAIKNKKQKQVVKRKRGQGRFVCNMDGCEKDFARADGLKRHQIAHLKQGTSVCPFSSCKKECSRFDNVFQHLNLCHGVTTDCPHCQQSFSKPDMVRHLVEVNSACHPSRFENGAPS